MYIKNIMYELLMVHGIVHVYMSLSDDGVTSSLAKPRNVIFGWHLGFSWAVKFSKDRMSRTILSS